EEATQNLLNAALEDILFQFVKIDEKELVLADEFRNNLRKTREALQRNFDQKDPEFVTLREELERLFKKKNLSEITQAEMIENSGLLKKIYEAAKELNRKNNLILAKYQNDPKLARVHKRLVHDNELNAKEIQIHRALTSVKSQVDELLEGQKNLLDNEAYFNKVMLQLVTSEFKQKEAMNINFATAQKINNLIAGEYLHQYQQW